MLLIYEYLAYPREILFVNQNFCIYTSIQLAFQRYMTPALLLELEGTCDAVRPFDKS
jgi:hypothetical protein